MRGKDLTRPFRGVRVAVAEASPPAASEGEALRERCAALQLAAPDGAFFTSITAARLWPLPLPRANPSEPIHLGVHPPARPPRRPGVAGHLIKDPRMTVVRRQGLPSADPATVFCQLGVILSVPDLVAVGDALVLQPVYGDSWEERPWVSLRRLAERVEVFQGRGKKIALEAVELIRPGTESRPETLVRLAIVAAGLPEPEVNVTILDADGRFIGRADLVYRRWLVIVEYDGDQHRTSTSQFDKDVLRLEAFASAGWTVVRVVGRSFFGERDACVARVRRALVKAGWRA
ncbi:MAG: DUF559 domain-containing protein [Nakamurella sp.]